VCVCVCVCVCVSMVYSHLWEGAILPTWFAEDVVGSVGTLFSSVTVLLCLLPAIDALRRQYARQTADSDPKIVAVQGAGGFLTRADFDLGAIVGRGAFAFVQLATRKGCPGHAPLALKISPKREVIRLRRVEHVQNERRILTEITHPFIISLVSTFQDETHIFMLMEYADGGDLRSLIDEEDRLSSDSAQVYSAELCLALQYLHGLQILHRDLKPENVLIDSEGCVKLADFGFAKILNASDKAWSLCGTPEYLAPEIILSRGHGKGVDWWALGILIFEMLAGYTPFCNGSPADVYKRVLAEAIDYPSHFDVAASDLIAQLLARDEVGRLGCQSDGAESVKRHMWYTRIDWEELVCGKDVSSYPMGATSNATLHQSESDSEADIPYNSSARSSSEGVFRGFQSDGAESVKRHMWYTRIDWEELVCGKDVSSYPMRATSNVTLHQSESDSEADIPYNSSARSSSDGVFRGF